MSKKVQAWLIKYVVAYLDKAAKIGVKGSKYSRTLIHLSTDDLAQSVSDLVNVCGSVELGGQLYCAGNDLLHLFDTADHLTGLSPGLHSFKNSLLC